MTKIKAWTKIPCIEFGAAVRERRKQIGMTQEDLSEETHLDPTYISRIERGRRNPALKNITTIAKALKTSHLTKGL